MEDIKYIHTPTGKIWTQVNDGAFYANGNSYTLNEIVEKGVDWKRVVPEPFKILSQEWSSDDFGNPCYWIRLSRKITNIENEAIVNLLNNEIKEGWGDNDMIEFYYFVPDGVNISDQLKEFKKIKEKGENKK